MSPSTRALLPIGESLTYSSFADTTSREGYIDFVIILRSRRNVFIHTHTQTDRERDDDDDDRNDSEDDER